MTREADCNDSICYRQKRFYSLPIAMVWEAGYNDAGGGLQRRGRLASDDAEEADCNQSSRYQQMRFYSLPLTKRDVMAGENSDYGM